VDKMSTLSFSVYGAVLIAAEAIIAAVPELQIWKTNLIAVASYFRRSALRTKLLHEIIPDARAFAKHHEERFAQQIKQSSSVD